MNSFSYYLTCICKNLFTYFTELKYIWTAMNSKEVFIFRNRVKNFGHIVSKEHDDKKDIDKTKHLPTYSNSK